MIALTLAIATLGVGAWSVAYRASLSQLSERASLDLAMASDCSTGHLRQYRELAVVLSEHPVWADRLAGEGEKAAAEVLLLSMADKTGAHAIELVDRSGAVLARSGDGRATVETTGHPLVRALNGALGTDHRFGPASSGLPERLFSIAAPIFGEAGPPVGAIIVEVNIWYFEQNWPTSPAAVFVSGPDGRVFVSNRSEMVLAERWSDEGFPRYDLVAGRTGRRSGAWTAGGICPVRHCTLNASCRSLA